MIFRRFGGSVESVQIDFDPKALTEVRFRRDREVTHGPEQVAGWQRVRAQELEGKAEGFVQGEVEKQLLDELAAQLRALEAGLGPDELLVVESEAGVDYPKTTTQQKTVNVAGENKLHFTSSLRPPLRVAVYRTSPGA